MLLINNSGCIFVMLIIHNQKNRKMAQMKNYRMPSKEAAENAVSEINKEFSVTYSSPQAEVKNFDGDWFVYIPWYIENVAKQISIKHGYQQ